MRSFSLIGALLLAAVLPLTAQGPDHQRSLEDDLSTPDSPRTIIDSIRRGQAVRVTRAPLIDGRLEEPVWQEASPLSDFIQRLPDDGAPASERTEVRILFDDEALYVGVWLFDTNAGGIVQGEAIRDSRLDDSDAVILVFDTYHDRQNGFVFGTNPSGIEYDGQVSNAGQGGGGGMGRQQGGAGGGFNLNWDGSWTVAASRDDAGWYAEFRIPFSTLRYGLSEDAPWGLNVMRRIRRRNEESTWSPIPRQHSLWRLTEAGILDGVQPPARRHATVTPYALQAARRDWRAGDLKYGYPGDVGADAKVQLTQGLTLDLSYNTDFAQVEVDDQQVNLTRFSLFFPEKRPFFLENAGLFRVGTGGSELFFSRSIGIDGGRPTPIEGGGRVSGRVGGLNVGLLHIRTGIESDLLALQDPGLSDGDAFSVVRVARELPNRSRIGGFFGHRTGTGLSSGHDDHNASYALDGQIGLGDRLTVSSFIARTETPGLSGTDHVFHLGTSYSSRDWGGSLSYREMGANFNPEVGFVNRTDYRAVSGMAIRYIRPNSGWFREIRPHVSYNVFNRLGPPPPDREEGLTGSRQSSRWHVDSHFETAGGALFSPAFDLVEEQLEAPLRIAPSVFVPPGNYQGWQAAWRFNTNPSAPLSFNGGIDWGHLFSGERKGGFGAVTARRGSSATVSLQVNRSRVSLLSTESREGTDLAVRDFDVTLAGFRLGYFFTPRIYLQSLVQYADQQDIWSANLRLGWLNTAGTGLFIVYNDARGLNQLSGQQLNRGLIVKFTRQFTFWDG